MSAVLPQIVLGTLPFGGVVSAEQGQLLVEKALEGGISTFDVSHLYGSGNALSVLRSALKHEPRSEVWCSVGLEQRPDDKGVFAVRLVALTEDALATRTSAVLEALGRSKLELLNVHAFDEETSLDVTLGALQRLKQSGIVDKVSYSNLSYDQAHHIVAADVDRVVDMVQLHGNVLERRLLNTSGKVFREHGRTIACFRPLARGLLTRGYSPSNPRPSDSRSTRGWRLNSYLTEDYLDGLEILHGRLESAGVSPLDFALTWLVHPRAADTAIVGVRDEHQLEGLLRWMRSQRAAPSREALDELIPDQLRIHLDQLPADHFER